MGDLISDVIGLALLSAIGAGVMVGVTFMVRELVSAYIGRSAEELSADAHASDGAGEIARGIGTGVMWLVWVVWGARLLDSGSMSVVMFIVMLAVGSALGTCLALVGGKARLTDSVRRLFP